MDFNDILTGLAAVIVLGVLLWWIFSRGGADRMDGSWLGMFFVGGIPRSKHGWNADSFKLYALATFAAAVIYLIVKVVLALMGE